MTGYELITALKKCELEDEVVFYYLKNDDLEPCKLETIINTEMGIELTIENINYEEV